MKFAMFFLYCAARRMRSICCCGGSILAFLPKRPRSFNSPSGSSVGFSTKEISKNIGFSTTERMPSSRA